MMKQLLLGVVAAAVFALVPASARACEHCNHDKNAATHAGQAATAKLAAGEARVVIPVSGMHCGHCAERIETALGKLDGVKAAEVRLDEGKAIVVFEKAKVAPSKLVEAIDALGYKAGKPAQG